MHELDSRLHATVSEKEIEVSIGRWKSLTSVASQKGIPGGHEFRSSDRGFGAIETRMCIPGAPLSYNIFKFSRAIFQIIPNRNRFCSHRI